VKLLDMWRTWRGGWRLEGWDTFAGHGYPLPGRYRTREAAEAAARRRLRQLEREQPSETSGGQDGIQDQVYIVSPTGEHTRIR
jgi:hypothetical protein